MVLLALVEVNGFGMNRGEGRGEVNFADNLRLPVTVNARVDDDEVVRRDRAQADGIRRVSLLDPVPAPTGTMQEANFR